MIFDRGGAVIPFGTLAYCVTPTWSAVRLIFRRRLFIASPFRVFSEHFLRCFSEFLGLDPFLRFFFVFFCFPCSTWRASGQAFDVFALYSPTTLFLCSCRIALIFLFVYCGLYSSSCGCPRYFALLPQQASLPPYELWVGSVCRLISFASNTVLKTRIFDRSLGPDVL